MSTSIEQLRQAPPAVAAPAALPIAAGEMAASAIAAQAKATVLARYEMALRQPRNLDVVRQDLMKECRRPTFANNKSAYYKKPIGDGVEGLGIRFVEVALRCMKNVLIESQLVYEDDEKEVHRVTVTDLEANTTYPQDVKVSKTVERRKPADDGSFISVRKNSYGKDVYTVLANDDDLLNKRAALISKAIRTLGLRVIPGWMQDEAEDIIKAVRQDEAARDPDEAKRKIIDAFGELNVTVAQLAEFLGHPVDTCQPQEIVDLRGFYGAIKDGETTWASIMENRAERKPPAGGTTKPEPEPRAQARTASSAKDLQQAGSATQQAAAPTPAAKPAAPPADNAAVTIVEVMAVVRRAKSSEDLDEARDLARSMTPVERSAANAAIEARAAELKADTGGPAPAEPQAQAQPRRRGNLE